MEFLLVEVVVNLAWINEEVRGWLVLVEVVDVVFWVLWYLLEGECLFFDVLYYIICFSLCIVLISEFVFDILFWSIDEWEIIIFE